MFNAVSRLVACGLAALAIAATSQAQAQLPPTGPIKPITGADLKTAPLRLRPLPARIFPLMTGKGSMDGWTALTDTATLGGASLLTAYGHTDIITTGADGSLYAASFDPAAPALIASWVYQPGGLVSEPHCGGYSKTGNPADPVYILCAGLTAAGTAKLIALDDHTGFNYENAIDLGGKSGPAAPNFLTPPALTFTASGWSHYFSYDVGVVVNGKIWQTHVRDADPATPWQALNETFRAAPVCARAVCYTPTANGSALRALPFSDGNTAAVTFGAPLATSPDAPVALSGEVAFINVQANLAVVVARGADSQLYQIAFDTANKVFAGGWKPDGGIVPANSWPSCVAVNQKPVCVIQGPDGKLYAKTLQGATAL